MSKPILTRKPRVNHLIRVPKVRLIDETGKQIGIIDTTQALALAQEKSLDLVEVAPLAYPPVCKIANFGSYMYQLEKQERKQRAKQKRIEVKGIRLSLKIGPHDLEMRKRQALKFFEKGDKVRIEMILRGREQQFMDRARQIMESFAQSLGENVVFEQPFKRQGRRLSMLVNKKQ